MNRPNSIVQSSSLPVRVRRRGDLVFVKTYHKHDSAVVVKDPVALKYHRLRPDEFFVLECLDGLSSLDEIRTRYEKEFPPTRVSASQLNQLLFRFHESGLTVSDAPQQGDRLTDKRQKERRQKWMQHISGILFIRFPGVDPEPLMRRIYPPVRPFLGFFGALAALMLGMTALVVFLSHRGQFMAEFPNMHQWLRFEALLILGLVIGGTKVLHELGHAIMCKHFGGECHQIGPMLLVFTPALYCDTSDSWMLPSRWQRAAVGLAGIGTEVILASVATLIWYSTAPGLTHTIAMNVMLVCGVSTVLFNANPLLRYDGYYVLSDLTDTPNLGEKARKRLSSTFVRWFAGVDETQGEEMDDGGLWLAIYAILAAIYRWTLSLVILWIVAIMLRPYGLESIGRALCVFAAGGLLFMLLRAPFRFLRNPARRRYIKMKRVVFSMCLLAFVVAACCYPLPSNVTASGRVIPRSETPIYISSSGELDEVLKLPGEMVQKDELVAKLANPSTQLEFLRAKGRYTKQKQLVETIKKLQFSDPTAANELPGATALLGELKKQLDTREQRVEALNIKAPASGRLLAVARRPPSMPRTQHEQEFQLVSWSGYPTDVENRECYLESGTELMSVSEDGRWDAELVLSQSEVQRIELGSDVKLVTEAMPSKIISGNVKEISRARWNREENLSRQDDPNASNQNQPAATSYIVRVELSDTEPALANGSTITSTVKAEPISVFGRVKRALDSLLRFR